MVLKMIVDDVTAYVGLYGWEHSVEEGLFFIGDTNNFMFDQFPDGYDARFFVVGFDYKDNAVVATTGLFKSEKFTTVEIVESNAWAATDRKTGAADASAKISSRAFHQYGRSFLFIEDTNAPIIISPGPLFRFNFLFL